MRGTLRPRHRDLVAGPRALELGDAERPAPSSRPPRLVRAPRHLRTATRKWFRDVVAGWNLEEHHARLLQLAAEAWDRCETARERIAKHGSLTVKSARGGPRLHPLLRVEAENRKAFARLLQQLDLEDAPTPGRMTRT